MQTPINTTERFLRRAAVENVTGLPEGTLYQFVAEGRFPKPLKISARIAVWRESEVQAWIRARIAEARPA